MILAVAYSLIALGVATTTVQVLRARTRPAAIPQPFAPKARYLVLIVLDGARPDYFGLASLANVDALRAGGTQYTNAMDGILETETPAGHATLTSGSPPSRTGILGFDWAQGNSDFSLFSPSIVRAGAIEHIMQNANVPTIAGLYKRRFPGAQVVALSGHKYYAADPLGGPLADAIMYYQGTAQGTYAPVGIPGHMPPSGVLNAPGVVGANTHLGVGAEDHLATELALSAFRIMHQRITLINYPEFDWPLGHVDGGNESPAKVITLMKDFDRDLGMIEAAYRKAGVLDQTLFVITADHGMAPITRFVSQSVIRNAVSQAGAVSPAVATNTAGYIWLTDPAKAQSVAQHLLSEADPGIASVYYRAAVGGKTAYLRAGGRLVSTRVDDAQRYLLGTLVNGHEPAVVAFCREGQSFASSTTNWRADHGGASWQSQHIPLIFSGPGIQSGVVTADPAMLEDVAPTLLADMQVKPTGMVGKVLTDALLTPTVVQEKIRKTEVTAMTPLVNALIAQDDYEQGLR